ncbi:MAG: hypothetical protein JRH11_11970 [Deltaproteobacteria bacterium]|nr:hypothetical protein [Deltaproteobacteria bacterium]
MAAEFMLRRNLVIQALLIGGVPLLLLASSACDKSHGAEDSGVTFDALPPVDGGGADGSPDGSISPAGDVGGPCDGAEMCDALCIEESMGWQDGYCSAECDAGQACPEGSFCTPVGRSAFICLAGCDPSATGRQCRTGYGCGSSFMLDGPVCVPGCFDATDCGPGLSCDPDGGFFGEGTCFDSGAEVGSGCESADMCPAGAFCLEEYFSGWPGGTCIEGGCDPDAGTGCNAGDVCLPAGRGGACFAGCTDARDCRPGYQCTDGGGPRGARYCGPGCTSDAQCSDGRVCNPALGTCDEPFDPAELGEECSTAEGLCAGGTCMTEYESGFPFSYCVYLGCDPAAPDPGCGGGNVCVEDRDGTGVCLKACEGLPDCPRDGYDCRPSDAADSTSETACLPACTTDASCANDGFVCNEGTGRCRPPFDPASIGQACEDGSCEGGSCLDEMHDGWPGGTCGFPGCRLSGTGPAEPCPSGSVCTDDGHGDPDIGTCVEVCNTSSSSCRTGYACITTGVATEGYCGPACTGDADCTDGGSCDMASGFCR